MIIALETSHTPGSVALAPTPDPASWTQLTFPPGLVHGRELFPHIDRIVRSAGGSPQSVTAVVVSAGPGSYTGVRIGVAAAKGLAWALGVPVVGVSTLEVIAQNVANTVAGEFAVMLDARRGHCYGARFAWQGDVLQRVSEDCCVPPAEFLQSLGADVPLVGAGARTFCDDSNRWLDEAWNVPQALSGLRAVRKFGAALFEPPSDTASGADSTLSKDVQLPVEYTDPHRLVPNYMRQSEAEEKADQRAPAEGQPPGA